MEHLVKYLGPSHLNLHKYIVYSLTIEGVRTHCVLQPVREEFEIMDDNKGKCCVGNDDFTRTTWSLHRQARLIGTFMKLAFY